VSGTRRCQHGAESRRAGPDRVEYHYSCHQVSQSGAVIETHDLAKSYGRFGALEGVSLRVPQGSVFALVGACGAGKTPAIKILLNIISPTRGRAEILGVDTRELRPAVLAKVGYVSESQVLPGRLRVGQFFDYLRPCYASWDTRLEQQLREQLRL